MIKKFNLFESVNYIPKIRMNGEYYHGTILQDNEIITNLHLGYSDFDAIWVTDDENKIPVKVSTKIVIGDVYAELTKLSGLLNKATAKIG